MRAEHDATILLCTHDLAEAETLADRIGILDRGRLLFLEPVADVKRRFGVETLEEAFFAATGREFENEVRTTTTSTGRCSDERVRSETRHQLVGLVGVVERNVYLVKRYVLVGHRVLRSGRSRTRSRSSSSRRAIAGGGRHDRRRPVTTRCSSARSIWAYLGIIFEFLTETVAWERWEGTIEYTFMAPLSRLVHLFGMGAFAVLYGVIRATLLFFVVAALLRPPLRRRELRRGARRCSRSRRSRSSAIGMMTAVLPLISPEKGAQLGFVAQGLMLVVSGVYYPVCVLPDWMQWIAKISPATYALRGDAGRRSSTAPGSQSGATSGRCS